MHRAAHDVGDAARRVAGPPVRLQGHDLHFRGPAASLTAAAIPAASPPITSRRSPIPETVRAAPRLRRRGAAAGRRHGAWQHESHGRQGRLPPLRAPQHPAGEALQRCRLSVNEADPFACPEGCLFFEERTVAGAGWTQPPSEPMSNTAHGLDAMPPEPKKRRGGSAANPQPRPARRDGPSRPGEEAARWLVSAYDRRPVPAFVLERLRRAPADAEVGQGRDPRRRARPATGRRDRRGRLARRNGPGPPAARRPSRSTSVGYRTAWREQAERGGALLVDVGREQHPDSGARLILRPGRPARLRPSGTTEATRRPGRP